MKNAIVFLLVLGTTSLLAATPSQATTPDPSATKAGKVKKARKHTGLLAKAQQKQAKKQRTAYARALERNELFR
ncbi:hypothetical protein KLP40_07675 [Hymenobacter sp. NST-14]|uniref:hypothetical protein n=1 Tax=Hymenobacter piscis TaxID=2839984 RepID=UPI001C00E8A4|nr:hypothetical protein [Hymenobacter piscis]MBT9393038.1 hypothetical protein [Hymenobacter piscis]